MYRSWAYDFNQAARMTTSILIQAKQRALSNNYSNSFCLRLSKLTFWKISFLKLFLFSWGNDTTPPKANPANINRKIWLAISLNISETLTFSQNKWMNSCCDYFFEVNLPEKCPEQRNDLLRCIISSWKRFVVYFPSGTLKYFDNHCFPFAFCDSSKFICDLFSLKYNSVSMVTIVGASIAWGLPHYRFR